MAVPTNTIQTNSLVGIREDLADVIYNIDPEDTPLFSATAKTSVKSTYHEWQTDALRASAVNAHIEGDDTTAEARTATTRVGNYTQIFKNAVQTSGTEGAVDKAGRAKEMAYQLTKVGKEQRLDIEKALFSNTARSAGGGAAPRYLGGLGAWIATNDPALGATGASPVGGNGTAARTDGTQVAFSQTRFDSTMQNIWTEGGKARSVYLSPFQMNVALGFTGNNNSRANVEAASGKVIKDVVMYRTPWGTVDFNMSRECRSRDVWLIQDDMLKIGQLRPMKTEELAKTGDNEKRQMLTELTLIVNNEAAHGLVPDNTTT